MGGGGWLALAAVGCVLAVPTAGVAAVLLGGWYTARRTPADTGQWPRRGFEVSLKENDAE